MPSVIGSVVPVLRVYDPAATVDFHLRLLGFRTEWEHRYEPGLPLYRRVRRDHAVLDLSEHHGDGTPGTAVWFPVDDVDALRTEILARNSVLRPGVDVDAPGGPTLEVPDPFGNVLRFCQIG